MPINLNMVKKIMVDNNITPKILAEKLNVSESRVSKILNYKDVKPQHQTIISLAEALNVKPSEIVRED